MMALTAGKRAVKKTQTEMDEKCAAIILKDFDVDKNGVVDKKEFCANIQETLMSSINKEVNANGPPDCQTM